MQMKIELPTRGDMYLNLDIGGQNRLALHLHRALGDEIADGIMLQLGHGIANRACLDGRREWVVRVSTGGQTTNGDMDSLHERVTKPCPSDEVPAPCGWD
jgi:hypothetical protein